MIITDPQKLADLAKEGGISVPADINDFFLGDHIHFVVFMTTHRGEEMPYPTAPVENAKLIASLTDEQVKSITIEDLIDLGFKFGAPTIALA